MTEGSNTNNKCRTCLKGSKGLQLLSKLITDEKEETNSFADFLKDITHIDIMHEMYGDMPQSICVYCIRKLKASHAFVRQVQEAHHKLRAKLYDENKSKNCLQEEQIDIQSCRQLNVESGQVDSTRIKEFAELNTCNPENGPVGIISTQDKSKNLRKKAHTHNSDLNDDMEPTTVVKNESTSEYEDDINKLDEDYSKLEGFTESDNESKSSTDSNRINTTAHTKEKRLKSIIDDNIPTSCDQCDRVFPNDRLLRRHKSRTHVPEELKVQCPFCPAKYARRYYMYAHMRTNHKDKPIEDHITKQHRKFPRQYACEQCDGNYTSKYYLLAHIKLKHNPDDNAPKKPERVLLPKKRFLCALCGSKFESPSNLNVHIRRHTGEKPFKCDLCDRTFYRPCDVQVHRRSHTGEKPFTCKICAKAFAKSNKLKIHMRAHSNERPYKCDQCEKAFKDSKNLKIHKRLHTGERPYTCSVCNSGFIKSTSLKLHLSKTQHYDKTDQEVA